MVTALREQKTQKYLRKLPLLHFTSSFYPGINLSEVYIICAQHLVSTSYSLFYSLLQLGLDPSNLSVIGKCYSTDPEAVAEMQKLGIDICPSSINFNSHLSFDQQYRSNIKKFVQERILKLRNNKFKKIVILDDGGELLPEVSSVLGYKPEAVGIEQTSSGYHKIKLQKLNYPVINVARSPAKLNHEAPIIARLILDSLIQNLKSLSLRSGKALIIGNGSIGSHIHKILKSTHDILVFDKIPSKSDIKQEEFEGVLKTFDLIIGCTGTSVLNVKEFNLLKRDAVLVSASSSDREFNAENLRKKIPSVIDCHQNLLIDGRWLINCGFPINFSSNFRAIDCDELQLTRSLLLAAILQAVNTINIPKKRFICLDLENQRAILQKYYSLFAKENHKEKIAIAI